ncbi:helix-turn-helix transcriptional regulator [Amycolatopsis mongoliensis]|uniref:Helix-turn-helix transcriptional regulator n=1 Tax=Amycolatopsis mongoliensis TaxID=715475 RepID=A0A9Y2JRG6_9PSEU|nr:helix-turn-helix transcriptional regulator [Amycolatopsis sp. 4-36]WIY02022.1 helix-turn-helix transcriptional regulator [Amycolatopsis sp. 4-36]
MKRARLARSLKVRELGRLTGLLPQNISNWENGKRVPKIEELATILGALRVEAAERARLYDLARNASESNWLEQYGPGMAAFAEYERSASAVAQWSPGLVPGLLQTPAYIRALFAATSRSPADMEKQVMFRLARREQLTGRRSLPYQAVLGESALRHNIGGPSAMAEQLRHLLAASRARNVSLRVLPDKSGYHPGLYGPFVLFDFEDLPPIVYLEHYRGNGYVYNRDHVADYRAAIESLSALALSEPESERLIQGVLAELEA